MGGKLGVTRLSQLELADLFNLLDSRGLSSSLIEELATTPATVSTNPARMIHDSHRGARRSTPMRCTPMRLRQLVIERRDG